MIIGPSEIRRPKITLENGLVQHDGKRCLLAMDAEKISVGCSDITPEAARYILGEWNKRFGQAVRREVLQQPE